MTEEKRLDELKAEEKAELSEEALEDAAGGVKYKEPQPRTYEKTGG